MMIVVYVLIYIAAYLWTAGALFADFQHDSEGLPGGWYRRDLGIAMFLAVMPPVWFMTPFMTGFYQYGWKLGKYKL